MNIWQTHGTLIKGLTVGAVLILLWFAASAWLDQREDRIRLNEQLSGLTRLLADRERSIKEINESMRIRDRELKDSLKKVEELKARPATIREIVKEIPHYIPLDTPPILSPIDLTAPDAPPKIVFEEEAAQGLRQFYLDCHAKTLKLQSCEDNADDWKRKEVAWAEKEKILEQQRDAAIRAVKGGGFWRRFGRRAKDIGIGGLIGGAIVAVAKR
jgi:hypothetical protein